MKRLIGSLTSFTAAILLSALSSPRANASQAQASLLPWEGHAIHKNGIKLRTEVDYLSTSKNFDSNGSLTSISGGVSAARVESITELTVGISDSFSLFGRLHWLYEQVGATGTVPAGALTGSVFGLGDETVGASYRIFTGVPASPDFELIIQSLVDFPGYSNSSAIAADHPFLGNGSIDWTTGAAVSLIAFKGPKRVTRLKGAVGFTYRTLGFSQSIPWSVFLENEPRASGLTARVGGYGFFSLNNDQGSSEAFRSVAGMGGSNIVNAINPALFNVEAAVGLRFKTGAKLLGLVRTTMAGTNAPSFFAVGGAIELPLGKRGDTLVRGGRVASKGDRSSSFVAYDLTATVTDSRPELHLVKIDRGQDGGIRPGARFDLFKIPDSSTSLGNSNDRLGEVSSNSTDEQPSGTWIARAECTHVRPGESVLRITEYVEEQPIAPGFIARRIVE